MFTEKYDKNNTLLSYHITVCLTWPSTVYLIQCKKIV